MQYNKSLLNLVARYVKLAEFEKLSEIQKAAIEDNLSNLITNNGSIYQTPSFNDGCVITVLTPAESKAIEKGFASIPNEIPQKLTQEALENLIHRNKITKLNKMREKAIIYAAVVRRLNFLEKISHRLGYIYNPLNKVTDETIEKEIIEIIPQLVNAGYMTYTIEGDCLEEKAVNAVWDAPNDNPHVNQCQAIYNGEAMV